MRISLYFIFDPQGVIAEGEAEVITHKGIPGVRGWKTPVLFLCAENLSKVECKEFYRKMMF